MCFQNMSSRSVKRLLGYWTTLIINVDDSCILLFVIHYWWYFYDSTSVSIENIDCFTPFASGEFSMLLNKKNVDVTFNYLRTYFREILINGKKDELINFNYYSGWFWKYLCFFFRKVNVNAEHELTFIISIQGLEVKKKTLQETAQIFVRNFELNNLAT